MKLSIAILEYELKKHFRVKNFSIHEGEELRLLSPLLYDHGETEDNRVYVLSSESLPKGRRLRGTEVLIFCDLPAAERPLNCCALYTDAGSTIRLFNALQQIYDKYQNWERDMCQILTEGRDVVQRIMDLSAEVHENMFELMDANFINAYVAFPQTVKREEPSYDYIIQSLYQPVSMDLASEVKQAFLTRRDIRQTMYHHISSLETLDYPLYKGSLYLGMLSMLPYARPFGRHDYAIVAFLGEYVAYALSVEAGSASQEALGNLQKVFVQLLDSKHISKQEIYQLYDAVGFREQDTFICAAIRSAGPNAQEFSNYISTALESTASCAILHKRDAYWAMVINVSLQERNNIPWREKLRTCLKSIGLQAGLSDTFSNFQLCELYDRSAMETLKLLPQDSPPDMYYFRDYRLRYVMEHFHGTLIPEMLYTDGFRRLLEYESSVTVSYIETLKVYLEENLNASRAARQLFISRNTFLARYARLCDILGEELDRPSGRFMLTASIWIYERLHGKKTENQYDSPE